LGSPRLEKFVVCGVIHKTKIDFRYQRAFIDFFEDQLVGFSYDWKALINYFLFDGEKPLIYSLIAGCEFPRLQMRMD
jgi:Questin oxidase-like